MIVEAKWCPRCRSLQPVEAFTRDLSKAEGVKSWCRACEAARCREYYHHRGGRETKRRYYRRKAERSER